MSTVHKWFRLESLPGDTERANCLGLSSLHLVRVAINMLGRLQLSLFSLSSDYEYLREHFREKHFLCEEGRCSTEQFTHAFRTEIDYKAHKTAFHSKNRAEARQNRQIDLQFNYAPRHQRRNEGKCGWGLRWTEAYSFLLL